MTKKSLDFVCDASELRNLILENPDLPLVIFSGSDVYNDGYICMVCTYVSASIGEVLDCEQEANGLRVYHSRTDFEDDIRRFLGDEFAGDDKEFDEFVAKKLSEYEPYWKKAIIAYVEH